MRKGGEGEVGKERLGEGESKGGRGSEEVKEEVREGRKVWEGRRGRKKKWRRK